MRILHIGTTRVRMQQRRLTVPYVSARLRHENILQCTSFPQQTCRTCNGVLSLGKNYGYDHLETAAALMKSETGKAGYRTLANILKNNRDKAAANLRQRVYRTVGTGTIMPIRSGTKAPLRAVPKHRYSGTK